MMETFSWNLQASEAHLSKHYDDLKERPFFPGLVKFMSTGPVCAMVRWEVLVQT